MRYQSLHFIKSVKFENWINFKTRFFFFVSSNHFARSSSRVSEKSLSTLSFKISQPSIVPSNRKDWEALKVINRSESHKKKTSRWLQQATFTTPIEGFFRFNEILYKIMSERSDSFTWHNKKRRPGSRVIYLMKLFHFSFSTFLELCFIKSYTRGWRLECLTK